MQEINASTLNLSDFNVNGQVQNELATTADLSDNVNFTDNGDGSYTTTENSRATASDIEALVDKGSLTEHLRLILLMRLQVPTNANDGSTIEIDGTFIVEETAVSTANSQDDMLTSLDFEGAANENGLIKM